MQYQTISLSVLGSNRISSDASAHATLHLLQPSPEVNAAQTFPCVVICPGGGYRMVSEREAEPIALCMVAQGYSAVVVTYSTDGYSFPTQLCELSLVVAMLRRRATEFHLNPEQIAVCGFSAGGHLAASLCNLWALPLIQERLQIRPGENRPNAAILGYPVISAGEYAHRGSFDNLLRDFDDPAIVPLLSLEHSVNDHCPPTFLWHTADDTTVPVENTLLYAAALRRCRIPIELHIYPQGPHGISLANHITSNKAGTKNRLVAGWLELAIHFLDDVFGVERW